MAASKKFYKIFYLFFFGFFLNFSSFGTHLKGGEITVKRVSDKTLTFEFTLTTYTEDNAANRDQVDVNFCFGDGSGIHKVARCCGTPQNIGNGTLKNIYKYTYTYPAAALSYKVSVAIPNRNEGVLNITRSVEVPFYVETVFSINAGLGQNSTPLLLNPAVDLTAVVGQPFIHNPNAVDAEGDSLAYRLSVSKTGDENICSGLSRGTMAPGFTQPNDSLSTFTINARTGDLIWNVPRQVGKYNCAFIIEEWRNGVKISETVRDMQIEVKDLDNRPPKLTVPPDVCVVAGSKVQGTITATDIPSKTGRTDPMTIVSTGNVYAIDTVYSIKPAYATFVSAANQTGTATGIFNWQTNCLHVTKQPYDVFFKVSDTPPISNGISEKLVDSKIWKIRVLAPSVSNLSTSIKQGANAIIVSWENYTCNLSNAQIILYRKQGNCLEAINGTCSTGMTLPGFTEIARLKSNVTQFEDINVGKNKNYVYVAVVTFLNENGVEDVSIMSNTSCIYIPTSVPIITNVSVKKTDTNLGEILVKWTRPIKLDTNLYKGPYYYQVLRADGTTSTDFKNVSALLPGQIKPAIADTSFIDIGLNTSNKIYSYKVKFYYSEKGQIVLMDASNQASNVYLYGQSSNSNKIDLAWVADVPWSNDFQIHRLYREYPSKSGQLNQIADVSVASQSTFVYSDNGKDNFEKDGKFDVVLKKDSTYCYVIETIGEYKPLLSNVKLVNASRKICFVAGTESNSNPGGSGNSGEEPSNNLKPCPPVLKVENLDCLKMNESKTCVFDSFTNSLNWVPATGTNCDLNIVKYNIYYSPTENGNFKLISTTDLLSYKHVKTDFIRGCYYVTAVNSRGLESSKSNVVCLDNCPNFELPNLFSPNGDLKNDIWLPMYCPRFVNKIVCKIVDRYGQIVYEYEGDINQFGWDGKNKAGNFAAPSTYFYECSVTFDIEDENLKRRYLKGWVELIR